MASHWRMSAHAARHSQEAGEVAVAGRELEMARRFWSGKPKTVLSFQSIASVPESESLLPLSVVQTKHSNVPPGLAAVRSAGR
jgi:hypothetical protein